VQKEIAYEIDARKLIAKKSWGEAFLHFFPVFKIAPFSRFTSAVLFASNSFVIQARVSFEFEAVNRQQTGGLLLEIAAADKLIDPYLQCA
jgi:hypothetical protein